MKIPHATSMLLVPILAAACGHAQAACSNQTLHGGYAFTITGQILAPAPAAGPVSGVALTYFDGEGGLTQVDHVVHGGIKPVEDWRPAVGSYSVNADCTGWMTFTPEPTNPADGGPELKLYITITEDGHEIRTVVSGSPNTPPFTANITSDGVRKAGD
jgi:hypothetical protein